MMVKKRKLKRGGGEGGKVRKREEICETKKRFEKGEGNKK